MEFEIMPKQEIIPAFDPNAVAVRHIEYYPYGSSYSEEDITPKIISKILREARKGISIYLSLNPDGECDWLEVVSDGKWLFLGYCFEYTENIDGKTIVRYDNYYSYNPDFADTADRIGAADFSDETIYSPLESGGQSPISKIQAITDIETGVKAVEYFVRTGELYPGMDWLHEF